MSGESSGDFYAAEIAKKIWACQPDTIIRGMGGTHSKAAGIDIFVDSSELGVIGVVEILSNIKTFIKIYFDFIRRAKKERPDLVLLIDYPGLNIRLGQQFAKLGIPVVWYISPQVWVWRKSNIPKFAKFCRRMIVIFPFEPEVWEGSGLDVRFAGHPLVEIVDSRRDSSIQRDQNRILLLPGSRHNEISRLEARFIQTALLLRKRHPELQFVMSTPRQKTYEEASEILRDMEIKNPEVKKLNIQLTCGDTAVQQQRCIAGLAASGTVTVESGLAGLPLVVAYRLSVFTLLLAAIFVRKLFRNAFTMVNIILNRPAFEEFLQWQVRPRVLADAMERILPGGSRRKQVEQDLVELRESLVFQGGKATENAAGLILETLNQTDGK